MADYQRMKASDWTEHKLNLFSLFITAYAAIIHRIQNKNPSWVKRWFYCDLTSGCGLIDAPMGFLEGSPLIALEAFRKEAGLLINCLFIEIDPGHVAELKRALSERCSIWTEAERRRVTYMVVCGNNLEVLKKRWHAQMRDCGPFGLLYWDGLGENIYPSQEINGWLAYNRNHDLLLMASATVRKRDGRQRLDVLLKTPRKVALTYPERAWGWFFGLATAWPPLANKLSKEGKAQFYFTDSEHGKRIVDLISKTKAERERQVQGRLW